MTISFRCDRCGQLYRVRDEMAGSGGTCRNCGGPLAVPTARPQPPRPTFALPIVELPREAPTVPVPAEAVVEHIERHLGGVAGTFRDPTPGPSSVDVVRVPPAANRPWTTLVTAGMSRAPMKVPPDITGPNRIELMLGLPEDWKLDEESFREPRSFWPLQLLRTLAAQTHSARSWIGAGHIVPNGEPLQPYAEGTPFAAALVLPPLCVPDGFASWFPSPGVRVDVLAVVPLSADECEYSIQNGLKALLKRLDRKGITEVLDPARRSCVRSWW